MVKRHAVPLGEATQVRMVRHDCHHLDGQRSGTPTVKDAVQTMPLPGDSHQHTTLAGPFMETPAHPEARADICCELTLESSDDGRLRAQATKYRPHEGRRSVRIVVVLRLSDQVLAG